MLRRARLATAGLYPVASLAVAALAYGAADTLHGSGFLAVYLAGPRDRSDEAVCHARLARHHADALEPRLHGRRPEEKLRHRTELPLEPVRNYLEE